MTDLEKFVELYKSFGIECKVNKEKNGNQFIILSESKEENEFGNTLITTSTNFDGYSYSVITFTEDGAFHKQGFWE